MDKESLQIQRAMEKGPYTIAVDLDRTLAEQDFWRGYRHIGKPIKKTVQWLRRMKKKHDAYIILHTCRVTGYRNTLYELSYDTIKAWIKKYKIPIDEIWVGTGKPFADIYLDDKAMNVKEIK